MAELLTDRLMLRRWRPEDRAPFAAMNADPVVMEHFPAPLHRAASDALVDRIERSFDEHGYGLWALERRADGAFLGFTGLLDVGFDARFAPALEVGWRLAADAWGQGYATEAGRASLTHAFDVVGVDEVVSFTATVNVPSQRVMQRLAMTHDPADDFDHPLIEPGDPLRRHVLYRVRPS
jgi:ribosomal-protein-alanine N-acetyltransferase